jgi:hypothetical protein
MIINIIAIILLGIWAIIHIYTFRAGMGREFPPLNNKFKNGLNVNLKEDGEFVDKAISFASILENSFSVIIFVTLSFVFFKLTRIGKMLCILLLVGELVAISIRKQVNRLYMLYPESEKPEWLLRYERVWYPTFILTILVLIGMIAWKTFRN